MRISDWSSDVCSSDLQKIAGMLFPAPERSDPFWAEAARAAFVGVGALVASNPGLPFTIGEIYRRLTSGDPKSDLPSALQQQIGRAHVRTPVPNAHIVCPLSLGNKNNKKQLYT